MKTRLIKGLHKSLSGYQAVSFFFYLINISALHKISTGETSSRRRATPPPETIIDVSMESPRTSMTETSSMKRPGPSSPAGKRPVKKHRGKQDNGRVASQFNWMAPVTASIVGMKATAASPQDPYAFIHVESSCMYFYYYYRESLCDVLTLS